ncbi:MAG: histidine phosphatase family protein [Halomonas sp.]|nr:histidine phosphatase family protein [Halomonas sp.]MDN6296485.1 histidine phosphatase family protein [Halomonas sp.]MDN6313838.1 histidine phosphatase family protein [Halomonas sp.]MDN6335292.1 histidine phosphatase family protein [Halomonas sp.]
MVSAVSVELVAVRHGMTFWNLERRYQGQRDIELAFPEAEAALERLRLALGDERFALIYSSDLTRCRQTLEWSGAVENSGVTPVFEPRLREIDFGDYEGKTYDELKDRPDYRAWIDSVGEQRIPGGENGADLRARLDAWLGDVAYAAHQAASGTGAPDGRPLKVLAVAHGGVIRELRRRFENVAFWDSTVRQAEGRRWQLTYDPNTQGGDPWQCSCSSAVPAPASATP